MQLLQPIFRHHKNHGPGPVRGSLSLCWGGRPENGWHDFNFSDPFPQETAAIEIHNQTADPSIFAYRSLV